MLTRRWASVSEALGEILPNQHEMPRKPRSSAELGARQVLAVKAGPRGVYAVGWRGVILRYGPAGA